MAYRRGDDTDDAFVGAMIEADGIQCQREMRAFVRTLSVSLSKNRGRRG